jgi:recombination DNA repair RAD52 pathway protein
MSYLNDEQIAQLLRPINERRVLTRDGMSHLAAYDVRAHLNRVVGFARWSADLTDLAQLFEAVSDDGNRVSVGYRATVRLTVCAPDGTQLATYTEAATGDAVNFPIKMRADAADFAIKTAESQALKRCAVNLGDQFGLSLYAGGSLKATVGRTLISATTTASDAVDEHVTEVVPESEQQEPAPDNHVQSEPPKEHTDEDTKALRVADLTTQLGAAKTRAQVAGIAGQVMKEKLAQALTDDGEGNVLTLGALVDATLKRVARAA